MKTLKFIPIAMVCAIAVACSPVESANDTATPSETVITSTEVSEPTAATGEVTIDEFAMRAASDSLAEIALGQLALRKAGNAEVRSFAQMMVSDHGAASQQLASIASARNLAVPTELAPEAAASRDRLEALSGGEFDREYMRTMIDEHQKAVDLFTRASAAGFDAAFADFARSSLPALQSHLEQAQRIAASLG